MMTDEKAKKIFNCIRQDFIQDYVKTELEKISCLTEESKKEKFEQIETFCGWCKDVSSVKTGVNAFTLYHVACLLNGCHNKDDGLPMSIVISDLCIEE